MTVTTCVPLCSAMPPRVLCCHRFKTYCNCCDNEDAVFIKANKKQIEIKAHLVSIDHLKKVKAHKEKFAQQYDQREKNRSITTKLQLLDRVITAFEFENARSAQPFSSTERQLKLQQMTINSILGGKKVKCSDISLVRKHVDKDTADVLERLNRFADFKPASSTQQGTRARSTITKDVIDVGDVIAKLKVRAGCHVFAPCTDTAQYTAQYSFIGIMCCFCFCFHLLGLFLFERRQRIIAVAGGFP